MRLLHRAGMERGDLIVVEVGGNECLGGVLRFDGPHVIHRYARSLEPVPVRLKIPADRGHGVSAVAQEPEVIGDVTCTAAEFAAHPGYEERDVQDMQLLGEDVVAKTVAEHHDRVVSDRATNERGPRALCTVQSITCCVVYCHPGSA